MIMMLASACDVILMASLSRRKWQLHTSDQCCPLRKFVFLAKTRFL
jgi:hypothetical protein